MRNISEPASGTWATFAAEARRAAGMTQEDFGKAVGVDRTTVWRWEKKGVKPENVDIVLAVAAAGGMDRAAGMRAARLAVDDGPAPASDPRLTGLDPTDPVVRKILAYDVDDEMKMFMLKRHRENLARAREQSLADVEFLAGQAKRQAG